MYLQNSSIFDKRYRNLHCVFLAFFCLCGCIAGVLVSYRADPFYFSLMRVAACRPVSIVDLPIMILLPFLVVAAISFLGNSYILFLLTFFKSLSYTLTFTSVNIAFGAAGWFVSSLMFLPDSICTVALIWYFLRHINGFRKTAVQDLVFVFLVSLSAGLVDSIWISSYLAVIINS